MADETVKFAEFLKSQKLDSRRVLNASHSLETLQREDRTIKLKKRQGKVEGHTGEKETRKPRSGRAVTSRAFEAALKGGKLSGPTKSRLLRAVNLLLEQKKLEKVQLKTLF